ncbi:MAG: hypothetical protein H7Y17_16335 [Chlorobia bacterium]|nr:hypothetical protein [Fimbriimonadaceae bacterium]
MVTIGDSFAIVALLGGICLSAWALIMAVALVFPGKAQQARGRLVNRPWVSFVVGLLIWASAGVVSAGMLASPLPLAKLIGWMGILGLASIAAVGSAGLATLASERLKAMAPDQTSYASLSKSAAYIVIAGLVPVLGWFLIVPFLIFASTGAGTAALLIRDRRSVEVPGFMP